MKKFILLIGILALALGLFADVILSGFGSPNLTQENPFGARLGYQRSAALYTSAEIHASGTITHLGWHVRDAKSTSIPIKIYLKNTTVTSLTAQTWGDITAGSTQVYAATVQFNTLGWAQLNITDFAYNYQTSGNLLVLCEANYGGYGPGSGNYPNFSYSHAIGNNQYWLEQNTPPAGIGSVISNRPNIKLYGITSTPWPLPYTQNFDGSTSLADRNWLAEMGLAATDGTDGSGVLYRRVNSNYLTGDILSPKIGPMIPNAVLKFDYRIVDFNNFPNTGTTLGANERFETQISTDGGSSFTTIRAIHQGNHVTSNTFAPVTIDLAAYSTGNIYVRFLFTGGEGNYYVHIDNFAVQYQNPLTVNPNPVVFGNGYITWGKALTVTVNNTGMGPLTINNITLDDNNNFHLRYLPWLPVTIQTGNSMEFGIRFDPQSPGSRTTNLRINTDAGNSIIPVSGTGVQALPGEICGIPYYAQLPLVDYQGTTAGYNNDYTSDMFIDSYNPGFFTGKDWVTQIDIYQDGLLNISLDNQPAYSSQWMGMILVSTIPSLASPAVALAQSYSASDPLTITDFPITQGSYYLIVGNYPAPADIHFVLNITHSLYPPEPAIVISPADGATNIALDASLNWESGGGTLHGYKLSLWEDLGTHQLEIVTDLDMGLITTYSPVLEHGKRYNWKVVPYSYGGGAAVDCPTWTFITIGTPISFPYYEGFEVSAGTLPLNWTATENAPNADQHWKATAVSDGHGPSAPASGSSFAWLNCYYAHPHYNPYSLVSPPLALDATVKRLSYQYWIGSDTVAEPLFVDISTDLASWTTLYTHSNATNTLAWSYNVISLAAYTSQTIYLRFRGVSNYGNGMADLGIDSVWIEDIPSYPILTCVPTDINFGNVTQGEQTGPSYVSVINTGGGILNLVAADLNLSENQANQFSFSTVNLPAALATGESVLIPIYVTASTEGPLYGTLQILNSQGPQPAYAYVDLSANGMPEGLVAIGDGDSNLRIPIQPLYGYSYSQSIFLQSEIAVADKRIEKVYYYWNGAAAATVSNDWTIYMGHTALTDFADDSSWIPLANLSQVFQANVALPASPGWIEIPLDTPFLYNNTANLVIAVDENEGGWDGDSEYFLSTDSSTNRSILYYADNDNPNPADPPAGNLVAGYPNLMLKLASPVDEPGTVTLNWPQEEATNLPRTGFDLSWTPSPYGGTPTHYSLYLNQTENSELVEAGQVFQNITATSFNTVTDGNLSFNYGEYWCWKVVAHNSYGSSEDNITNRFRIQDDSSVTIPHTQNFDANTMPLGWTQARDGISSDRWSLSESAEAGGEANELMCEWINESGTTRLISPVINTGGVSSFEINFQHYFIDYDEGCTASLQYSYDLQTWYEAGWSFDSGNGDVAGNVSFMFTPWSPQPVIYLAWTISGDHYQFDQWYIDNVSFLLPLTPVSNLSIVQGTGQLPEDMMLTWTAVDGADWYQVYMSDDPYTGFVPLNESYYNGMNLPASSLPADKAFFKVEARRGSILPPVRHSRPAAKKSKPRAKK